MKMTVGDNTAKYIDLEGGPLEKRLEIRVAKSSSSPCFQYLKIIIYLELIFFLGFLGFVTVGKCLEGPWYPPPVDSSLDPPSDTTDSPSTTSLPSTSPPSGPDPATTAQNSDLGFSDLDPLLPFVNDQLINDLKKELETARGGALTSESEASTPEDKMEEKKIELRFDPVEDNLFNSFLGLAITWGNDDEWSSEEEERNEDDDVDDNPHGSLEESEEEKTEMSSEESRVEDNEKSGDDSQAFPADEQVSKSPDESDEYDYNYQDVYDKWLSGMTEDEGEDMSPQTVMATEPKWFHFISWLASTADSEDNTSTLEMTDGPQSPPLVFPEGPHELPDASQQIFIRLGLFNHGDESTERTDDPAITDDPLSEASADASGNVGKSESAGTSGSSEEMTTDTGDAGETVKDNQGIEDPESVEADPGKTEADCDPEKEIFLKDSTLFPIWTNMCVDKDILRYALMSRRSRSGLGRSAYPWRAPGFFSDFL